MTKAERFINYCQRTCSNRRYYSLPTYNPWLTPEEARMAVEIAREETIEKACEWLENFCNEHYIMSYSDCNEVVTKELIEIFIKKMEE